VEISAPVAAQNIFRSAMKTFTGEFLELHREQCSSAVHSLEVSVGIFHRSKSADSQYAKLFM
jgi:hypothetical protein